MDVITELSVEEFQALVSGLEGRHLVVRFTAPWCAPCRRIEPMCHAAFAELPGNFLIAELDIEETLDLYSAFTKYKMIKGVPAMMLFRGDVDRDRWFIPDDSVSGDDMSLVSAFFERCHAAS
tara:strand:+ start:681 stop:1046 length:366 start_codon:yes stop_codon:yes gene_type:complete